MFQVKLVFVANMVSTQQNEHQNERVVSQPIEKLNDIVFVYITQGGAAEDEIVRPQNDSLVDTLENRTPRGSIASKNQFSRGKIAKGLKKRLRGSLLPSRNQCMTQFGREWIRWSYQELKWL